MIVKIKGKSKVGGKVKENHAVFVASSSPMLVLSSRYKGKSEK